MVDFTQAESRLLKDATIQFRFPTAEPRSPTVSTSASLHGLAHGWWEWASLGAWLFWTIVAIVALLVLAVVVQALRNRGRREAAGVAPDWREESPPARAPAVLLADADALAARGEYGRAVHTLLLRGVSAIQRGFPRTLAAAHTSRDIAALPALPAAVRDAFALIAARAEHAVFGQRPLGQADWDMCRATYAGLLEAAGWKGQS